MSRTACSGSAVLSTIIAFNPPVSAISGASAAPVSAIARWMRRAVSAEPVKHTPSIRGFEALDLAQCVFDGASVVELDSVIPAHSVPGRHRQEGSPIFEPLAV